jgi:glutathione S-transferase
LSGLNVINDHLDNSEYFGGSLFTLTDIVVGWTLNWARRLKLTEDFPAIKAYLARLVSRPQCSLAK